MHEIRLHGETMARRSDHTHEELADLVIETTGELVDAHGAAGVTARLIARRIGYTPGTLYTHFANLEDILLHVNARSLEQLRRVCEAATSDTRQPVAALLEMGYAYLAFAESHPHRFELLFKQQLPPGERVPAHLQQNIDALFALVEKELVRLAPDVDARTLELGVRALWSGVHGVVSLSIADQLFTRHWRADRPLVTMLITQFVASWPPPRSRRRH